jgi:hypothetical protein
MKHHAVAALLLTAGTAAEAGAQTAAAFPPASTDLQAVAPALGRYEQDVLFGQLWRRPDLSARDRSIVTLSALIARNQAASGLARSPASSRISPSMPAGGMPARPPRRRGRSSRPAASPPASFPPPGPIRCRWTRPPRRGARPAWRAMSAP